MARKTKQEKAIEAHAAALFKRHGNGVQFDMYDIGKIDNELKAAIGDVFLRGLGDAVLDTQAVAIIAKYRKN